MLLRMSNTSDVQNLLKSFLDADFEIKQKQKSPTHKYFSKKHLYNGGEIIICQYDVRCFLSNICTRYAHSKSNICFL